VKAMCTLAAASALAAVVSIGGAAAQTPQPQAFEIPGHGGLRLDVPPRWRVDSRPLDKPPSVAVHLTPVEGDAFDIQISALWLDAKALGKTTAASMRENMRRAARALLGRAEERREMLLDLQGAQSVGCYFSLTDRNPGPGEFKYLTQGSFRTGEVEVAFTVLHRSAGAPELGRALRMFAESTYESSGTADQVRTDSPRAAVAAFLALVDDGRYREAWDSASSVFKGKMERPTWERFCTAVRRPLGRVRDRSARGEPDRMESLPGAPDHEGSIFSFLTRFDSGEVKREIVAVVRRKGGPWQMGGYLLEPAMPPNSALHPTGAFGVVSAAAEARRWAVRTTVSTWSRPSDRVARRQAVIR
jgi:hypothetical protein